MYRKVTLISRLLSTARPRRRLQFLSSMHFKTTTLVLRTTSLQMTSGFGHVVKIDEKSWRRIGILVYGTHAWHALQVPEASH